MRTDQRAGLNGGKIQMSNAEYFRRHAATCLRLAQVCRDLNVARRLFGLADEFRTKAAEIDGGLQAMTLPPVEQGGARGRD